MRLVVACVLAMVGASRGMAAQMCEVPDRIARPHLEAPSARDPMRNEAIGGYTLSMIWLPQHCRQAVPGASSLRCPAVPTDRFVLHGLWPDGIGKTWPQWCSAADVLPQRLIRRHWCATPSAQLQQHEWAKHGTCMAGYTPERFFALSRRLFDDVSFPDMDRLSRSRPTADAFVAALKRANPQMPADAIAPVVDRDGWLEEVRLCLDPAFRPAQCKGETPQAGQIRIWRARR